MTINQKVDGKENFKEKGGYMEEMTMTETARLILGLRAAGFNEKEINDFILYIETGKEEYKPKSRKQNKE